VIRDRELDDLLRGYLADAGANAVGEAPSFDEAVRRVASRLGRRPFDGRMTLLLVAALLAVALAASALLASNVLPRPNVRETEMDGTTGSVVYASGDQVVLRDMATGVPSVLLENVHSVVSIGISPDGRWIAFQESLFGHGGPSPSVMWIVDARGSEPARLTPAERQISQFDWSPDSARIATVLPDAGRVSIISPQAPGTPQERDLPPGFGAAEVRWSPVAEEVFVRDGRTGEVILLPIAGGEPRVVLPGDLGSVTDRNDQLSISVDGTLLAATMADGVRLVDLASGRVREWLIDEVVLASDLSPDGRWVAALTEKRVAIGAVDENAIREVPIQLDLPVGAGAQIVFSPDSAKLLVIPGLEMPGSMVHLEPRTVEPLDWGLPSVIQISWEAAAGP
jgi:dipeptidyl aminopeptidase/acylaminoacyl peptidase